MSTTQHIRLSLAVGYVMGAAMYSSGEMVLVFLVGLSAVGLSVWSIWSNEQ